MSVFNYKKLCDEIAKKIRKYLGRKYVRVAGDKWIDEEEKLNRSLVNNSFAIFPEGKVDDDSEESTSYQLLVLRIEFALDSMKDGYLGVLGDCEQAIQSILDLGYTEVKKSQYNPDMELSFEGALVRVVFTVNYIIRNK